MGRCHRLWQDSLFSSKDSAVFRGNLVSAAPTGLPEHREQTCRAIRVGECLEWDWSGKHRMITSNRNPAFLLRVYQLQRVCLK